MNIHLCKLKFSAIINAISSIILKELTNLPSHPNADFIELYNPTSETVSLADWKLDYASSTGIFPATTPNSNVLTLSGSIPPGGYFLTKHSGGANGAALPTPDATGTLNLAAASGKVRLSNATGAVVDLVGYGTAANLFEGAGPTGNLSNTTAARIRTTTQPTLKSDLRLRATAPPRPTCRRS
ncbi:lamin tail domain-containing protein [Paenibacillus pasadenensis]|uniref:lamin tail domain-containing protein n=1 Tax=Paenibacillus pasadenensis TaxID=217090 RepID=UPI00210004B7|nr:lamin tail domain-containing protein [Paenibacillus pasadenensis]